MTDRKPLVIATAGAPAEMAAGDALPASVMPLDVYRYKKAVDAYLAGGVDSMRAFITASSESSPAMRAYFAMFATSGGDFETLVVLPWLEGSTSASPPGLGQSAAAAAATIVTLRASALSQSF